MLKRREMGNQRSSLRAMRMGKRAMYVNHQTPPAFGRATEAPLHPNYQDEMTAEQMAAIRKAADPDGSREAERKPLYNPGW